VRTNGASLRRFAYWGARYGPTAFVKHSPTFIGLTFFAVLPDLRARVQRNLRRVRGRTNPVTETVDVVRTFVEYAHCFAESLAADRPEAVAATPVVIGADKLRAALAKGRGAVLVTAHTGAWDVAARSLARDVSADVAIVMAKEPDEDARALQDSIRDRTGVRVLHVGEHPVDALPALRHLKQGGVLAIQLDRAGASAQVVSVPLAGEPFPVPTGPFRLASLGGCPVLTVFTKRVGYFRYEVTIGEPIVVPHRASDAQVREAASAAALEMERFVSRNPTQWFHFS